MSVGARNVIPLLVPARALVQAIKRNADRFPPDFMFQMTGRKFQNLKSQIVTSSWGGLRRARPYASPEAELRRQLPREEPGKEVREIKPTVAHTAGS